MLVGGALEKWPIFKSLLITLRTGDMLVLMIVMVIMNFEAKKLSGRSPFYGKTAEKSVFTSDSTSDSTSQAHISACTSSIDPETSTQYHINNFYMLMQ